MKDQVKAICMTDRGASAVYVTLSVTFIFFSGRVEGRFEGL